MTPLIAGGIDLASMISMIQQKAQQCDTQESPNRNAGRFSTTFPIEIIDLLGGSQQSQGSPDITG